MPSRIVYWKLDNPQPFKGVDGLIDALQISASGINGLNFSDATIPFIEGKAIVDEKGAVASISNISGEIKSYRWNDETYAVQAGIYAVDQP